jgi:hypothetical protein
LIYLLLPTQEGEGWQHCLWQQAPRLRVTATARRAVILVTVMLESHLLGVRYALLQVKTPRGILQPVMKKSRPDARPAF